MRPLEMNLTMNTHFWLFERLKETLLREGLIAAEASDAEVRDAMSRWLDMVEKARKTQTAMH